MSSSIGRVPEPLIQEILARVDITELVGRFVKLKKAGLNLSGLCPFHHEKTPSFTVSAKKQFYHCFGCGAHGDAIAFLMEHQGLSFVDALESLADTTGIELPKVSASAPHVESLKPLHEVLKAAAIFFHQQWKIPEARSAINYLKDRGMTKEIVNQFAVGFAPKGWENLSQYLARKGFDETTIKKAGLAADGKKGGIYDKFRNRIMFPIRDIKGRVLGFGGRALEDEMPKYLNSPETAVFHKSECLYGLFEAKFRGSRVILVEGYMDVIALAEHGLTALATLGTAVTESHLKHLFRYYEHVVFCFDGDKAGQQAAWKACLEVIPLKLDQRQVDFIHLPQGQDPDTYIRNQGARAFEKQLDEAVPFSDYFFNTLTKEIPATTLDNRARLVKKGLPLLQALPQGVFKSMMLDKLNAWKYEKGEDTKFKRRKPKPPASFTRIGKLKKTLTPCETLGLLLVQYPEWLALIESPEILGEGARGHDLFLKVVETIVAHPGISRDKIKEKVLANDRHWSSLLNQRPWDLISEEGLEEEFLGAIARLSSKKNKKEFDILLEKAKNGELSDLEKKRLKELHVKGN